MAPTDLAAPAPLDDRHLGGCLALSAEAGWNQTTDDWALFMRHGTVFGVCADAAPVATGAVLPYGREVAGGFAWIGMVLVTAAHRRARLGTRILETCLDDLARRRLVPVLDATPAGERVYRPLGFVPAFGLTRWMGDGVGTLPPAVVRAARVDDRAAVVTLDAAAFGVARAFLIESLLARAPAQAFLTAAGDGFVLARPGRLATQVGPLVASDEDTAIVLLDAALAAVRGPVFLDVADRWPRLAAHVRRRGFGIQRSFQRMAVGRSDPFGDPARLFVVTGPEFG
jgi:hypothetical protein